MSQFEQTVKKQSCSFGTSWKTLFNCFNSAIRLVSPGNVTNVFKALTNINLHSMKLVTYRCTDDFLQRESQSKLYFQLMGVRTSSMSFMYRLQEQVSRLHSGRNRPGFMLSSGRWYTPRRASSTSASIAMTMMHRLSWRNSTPSGHGLPMPPWIARRS